MNDFLSQRLAKIDKLLLDLLQQRIDLGKDLAQQLPTNSNDFNINKWLQQQTVTWSNATINFDDLIQVLQLINKQLVISYQQQLLSTQRSTIKIAYLGLQGSYSYLAAHHFAKIRNHAINQQISCADFAQVFTQVEQGNADYAALPIENTSSGSINEVYDLLSQTKLKIVDEIDLIINHSLLAKQEIDLAQIEVIYSHSQPFSQCSKFLQQYCKNAKLQTTASTSHAIEQYLTADDQAKHAVIANAYFTQQGLQILADNISNHQQNYTRFFILSKQQVHYQSGINYKTTIRFETSQQFGALATVLNIFKNFAITLTKLESRPMLDQPWKEAFFAEVEGHQQQIKLSQALQLVDQHSKSLQILGSYPTTLIHPINSIYFQANV